MILESLDGVSAERFAARTDWQLNGQGFCRGEICVPAPESLGDGAVLDIPMVADRLGMPLVHDHAHGVYALGPATVTGRALSTAVAADPGLITRHGAPFHLSSLRGRKVVLVAWASY
jgi:hypothetical protein